MNPERPTTSDEAHVSLEVVRLDALARHMAGHRAAVEADRDAPPPEPRAPEVPSSRRWAVVAAGVVGVLALGGGAAIALGGGGRSGGDVEAARAAAANTSGAAATVVTTAAPATPTTLRSTTTTSAPAIAPPTSAAPAVPMTVPVANTNAPADSPAAATGRGAVYQGGKLTLQGNISTRALADAFKAKAVEILGAANVIDNYVIDPSAPDTIDGRVRVADPVLFKTGSADLDPQYAPLLDAGVVLMKLNPKVVLQVVGHTDDLGTDDHNLALSVARAQAVVDYVTRKGGFGDDRFDVRGVGSSQPIADNATAAGRSQNRRIEVTILGLLDASAG